MMGQYLFQDYDGEEMTTAMLQALDRIAAHVDPEKHSSKELDSYGPIALAGVALAAASGDVKVDILKSICQRLSTNEHAEKTMSEFSASSLTKLCWALAVANHRDKKVMAKIGMEIASRSCEFSGEELAKCLCAFAELRFFHEEMMPELSVQLMWKVDQLSARSLAQVAVSCAQLEYCKQPLLDWLASRMCLRDRTLSDISSMVWAFAKMSVQHDSLCETAAQDALKSEDLTEQEHARLLSAFGKRNLDYPVQGLPRPLFHQSLSGAESVCKRR